MCGEETESDHSTFSMRGTPPRVWGRVKTFCEYREFKGDTPTCVGKSIKKHFMVVDSKGHPHVCGEEKKNSRFFSFILGTPPRVWGRGRA